MMYNYTNYNQQPQQRAQMTELEKEDYNILQNGLRNDLVLDLTEYEMARGSCPHRRGGDFKLTPTADGLSKCSICNETFNLVEVTEDEVKLKVLELIDILQSIKTLNVEMPINVLKEFMPIIEYLKKVPRLYTAATSTFQKYDVSLHNQGQGNAYGFNVLGNIMGGGYGMPMGQQPMNNPYQGQPMGQPMNNPYQGQPMGQPYQGQPMGQPYMGQPMGQPYMGQQPNPFAANGGDPTMGQQPQAQPAKEGNLESAKSYSS